MIINDIKNKNKLINKLELKLHLAEYIFFFLNDIPNPYEYKELDYMRLKFIRYSMRAIFFLKKYNKELIRIYNKIEKVHGFEKILKIRIDDDIYHYFDAAIVFSKSITEKSNVINPSIISTTEIQDLLLLKMNFWKEKLDEMSIGKIRNEITHLNKNGTSLDSWVLTDGTSSSFKLLEFLNKKYDINDYFNKVFELIICIIDESLGLIISEYINLYGVKSIDEFIIINKKKIKLSDLKLFENIK